MPINKKKLSLLAKRARENEAIAKAIIERVNRDEAARKIYEEKKMGEQPLQDEHPGLDLALMYAQPGGLLAKVMAPSMAKGMVNGLANGEGAQALLSNMGPITYNGRLLRRIPDAADNVIDASAPYRGRNFVHHGVPSDFVSDVLHGESRTISPSLGINRPADYNDILNTPFWYGDYEFIGDKSMLDDAIMFRGDAMSPTVNTLGTLSGDYLATHPGQYSIPSHMREAAAEDLWLKTLDGPLKATGPRIKSIEDLDYLPMNTSDAYFEAIHHGTIPMEKFKYVIAEEPGVHLSPTGLTKNQEEDILNWMSSNGVKVKTFNPVYKPYRGYDGRAEALLDIFSDPNNGILFGNGGSINIKPSHRGRLTELKARTGKSEAELYNDGNPAHKKMVVFARNARKWHADGGPIDYSGIVTTKNRPYNADYISYIDAALANGGMNDYQRAAVLANIIEESGGDPFAEGPGGFYGLLQWSGERYPKTNEKDAYKEIDNQVRNILATAGNSTDKMSWTHGGKGSGYNSFKDAMDAYNGDNLEDVMRGYTLGYVRPSGGLDSYNNRLKVAKQLYNIKGFRRFDAGGFMQKYGRDKILAALKKMKQSS